MEEVEKVECLIPFSLEAIEKSLKKLSDIAKKDKPYPEKLLVEFRNVSSIFFKKYGKDCSCNKCQKMIENLINIILNKIHFKVLNLYGIQLSSINLKINEHIKDINIVIEKTEVN